MSNGELLTQNLQEFWWNDADSQMLVRLELLMFFSWVYSVVYIKKPGGKK